MLAFWPPRPTGSFLRYFFEQRSLSSFHEHNCKFSHLLGCDDGDCFAFRSILQSYSNFGLEDDTVDSLSRQPLSLRTPASGTPLCRQRCCLRCPCMGFSCCPCRTNFGYFCSPRVGHPLNILQVVRDLVKGDAVEHRARRAVVGDPVGQLLVVVDL